MNLEIDTEEHALLIDVLERTLSSLREEIYKTDTTEVEQALKRRESVLTHVLSRLRSGATGVT
jgi:hypothetical protein